jgi:omega-6 fatty acid desaturase (delta-12 desaturase)
MAKVRAAIPAECFERRLSTSLRYAAMSVALTGGAAVLAWKVLPLGWVWLPMWVLYAVVCGTFATGVWVVAHECGHGAFCDNMRVQNTIGFVLHSALLVPYFSWQRSHSIHHAKTNHVTQGETHVPPRANTRAGARALASQARLGPTIHGSLTLLSRLLFGWPVYLLAGITGGATKGVTNHFWPWTPFSRSLFPARLTLKVLLSTAGVLVTIALLAAWAIAAGSMVPVLALFVGPWLVVNAWVVSYTWLHHTDIEIPHYDESEWSFVRGAWCSVDRPYGRSLDFLHHHIGSTHAAHHLFPRLPHYHAAAATRALAESFPELYRYDPTPVPVALWRISKSCVAVTPSTNGWRFVDKQPA